MRIKGGLLHRLFQTSKNKVKIVSLTLIKKLISGYIKTQSTISFTLSKTRENPI